MSYYHATTHGSFGVEKFWKFSEEVSSNPAAHVHLQVLPGRQNRPTTPSRKPRLRTPERPPESEADLHCR